MISVHKARRNLRPTVVVVCYIVCEVRDQIQQASVDVESRGCLGRDCEEHEGCECQLHVAGGAEAAVKKGLRVRGYVSVVIACPYSGRVDYKKVREVSKALVDMGCYEVSLGDTVGMGTPYEVAEMIEEVKKSVPVEKLAVSS